MSRIREHYGSVMIEFPGDTDTGGPGGSSHGMQFSSDDTGSGPTSKAISVKKAAELRGIAEGELAYTLRQAKAKLAVRDKRLFVKYDDLLELTRQGKVPKATSSTADREAADELDVEARTNAIAERIGLDLAEPNTAEQARPEPIADPLAKPTDPAVDARTAAVAERLGIDLGIKPEPAEQTTEPVAADATTQTVSAKPRSRTRLGAPKRWSQR
jgi:hypothetical protein